MSGIWKDKRREGPETTWVDMSANVIHDDVDEVSWVAIIYMANPKVDDVD